MRSLRNVYALVIALFAVLGVGCEKESAGNEYDPNNPPVMVLDTYQLNIDGGGGDIPLFYALQNPISGASPEIVCSETWISLKEVTATQILLRIEPNDKDVERFASLLVKYPYMEKSLRVNVLQDKRILNMFRFEVTNLDYNSCTVKYMPTDKGMQYMANIIDAEYFKQSGINDMSLFIDAEMSNYRSIAERNHMTLEELMGRVTPQLIYRGDAVRSFENMKHGSKYVAYSYGVTFNGNDYTVTVPMHQTIIDTPMPDMYNVSFGISSQMSGTMASISIDTKGWAGYYNVMIAADDTVYYIEPGDNATDSFVRSLASKFYDQAQKAVAGGHTVEQFLNSTCHKGNKQIMVQLESGKRYMVIVFAVDVEQGSLPVMRSMPVFAYL